MTSKRVDRFRSVERPLLERLLPGSTEHVVGSSSGSIRVVEAGSGPPVVFLHGLTGTLTNFAALAADLTPAHWCLLVDLPGHGLSGPLVTNGRSPRELLVAAVDAVLTELADGAPAVLVGNSLGGMAALYTAADRPQLVAAVAALGAPAYTFPEARARFPLDTIGRRGLGPVLLGSPLPPLPVYARTLRRAFGPRALAAIGDEALDLNRMAVWVGRNGSSVAGLMRSLMGPRGFARDGVPLDAADRRRITMPVWFLWGADDPFMSAEEGRSAVDRLENATIAVVPGGHLPWLDDPELTRERIASLPVD